MPKYAVWRRSDIQDPERVKKRRGRTKVDPVEVARAPILPSETMIRVKVGNSEWSTKLLWIADLLSDAEQTRLYAAISGGRSLSLGKRRGRAAMMISANGLPVDAGR